MQGINLVLQTKEIETFKMFFSDLAFFMASCQCFYEGKLGEMKKRKRCVLIGSV